MNKKLLSLLKYLDANKVTAEAVAEILSSFGMTISADEAAAIATAYKTRGLAGLVPHLPSLIQASQARTSPRVKLVYQCKKCGSFGVIHSTIAELEESGSVLDSQEGD